MVAPAAVGPFYKKLLVPIFFVFGQQNYFVTIFD